MRINTSMITLFAVVGVSACSGTTKMPSQQEEAFKAKVLKPDEKMLMHRKIDAGFSPPGGPIGPRLNQQLILTDKGIYILNKQGAYSTPSGALHWNYADVISVEKGGPPLRPYVRLTLREEKGPLRTMFISETYATNSNLYKSLRNQVPYEESDFERRIRAIISPSGQKLIYHDWAMEKELVLTDEAIYSFVGGRQKYDKWDYYDVESISKTPNAGFMVNPRKDTGLYKDLFSFCKGIVCKGDEKEAYSLIQKQLEIIGRLKTEVARTMPAGTDEAVLKAAVMAELRKRRKND